MNRRLKSAVAFMCAFAPVGFTQAVRAEEATAPAASLQPPPNCAFTGSAECQSSSSSDPRETSRALLLPANDAAASKPESADPLQLQGDAAALRLDLHQTTIADVLSALRAAFHIKYRFSIPLNERLTGTYAGSLQYVIARVLNGYNYVIKQDSATLDLLILGKVGERSVANPGLIPLRQRGAAAYRAKRE
jgi:hypothetical protein